LVSSRQILYPNTVYIVKKITALKKAYFLKAGAIGRVSAKGDRGFASFVFPFWRVENKQTGYPCLR
jgi:hypothetical protein